MSAEREDVNRAAHNMLARFGDNALCEADKRIEELCLEGQHEAADLWRRVREVLCLLVNDQGTNSRH